jgi:hypothetical protein
VEEEITVVWVEVEVLVNTVEDTGRVIVWPEVQGTVVYEVTMSVMVVGWAGAELVDSTGETVSVVTTETVKLADSDELVTGLTTVLLVIGALLETGLTTVLLVTGTLLETGLTTVLLVTGALLETGADDVRTGRDSVDVLVQPPEHEVMVKVEVDRVVMVRTDPLEVVVIVQGTVVRMVVVRVSMLVVPLAGTEAVLLATELKAVVLLRKPDEVLDTGDTGELLLMTAEEVVVRGMLDDEGWAVGKLSVEVVL